VKHPKDRSEWDYEVRLQSVIDHGKGTRVLRIVCSDQVSETTWIARVRDGEVVGNVVLERDGRRYQRHGRRARGLARKMASESPKQLRESADSYRKERKPAPF
jgi:hypothetical protein